MESVYCCFYAVEAIRGSYDVLDASVRWYHRLIAHVVTAEADDAAEGGVIDAHSRLNHSDAGLGADASTEPKRYGSNVVMISRHVVWTVQTYRDDQVWIVSPRVESKSTSRAWLATLAVFGWWCWCWCFCP